MANLYAINRELLACIDPDTGEVLDVEKFESLSISKSQKIENIALLIKNLQSDVQAFDGEVGTFKERKVKTQKKIKNLQRYLLDTLGNENFSTKKCEVKIRAYPKVEILDVTKIPLEFMRSTTTTTTTADKNAIKAAIKAGQTIDGCQLIENLNISVK